MNARYVIGGLILVVFIVWGSFAFLETTVQYVSFETARNSNRTVQVMGKIDFDRLKYNIEQACLEFAVYDAEALDEASADRLPVVYYGPVPGNLEQATSVVLKGKSDNGVFIAEQILVKCPSKYQGDESREYQDFRKHNQETDRTGL